MKQEFLEKIEAYLKSEITYQTLNDFAKSEGITDLDEKIEWVRNATLAVEADGLKDQLKAILPIKAKREAKIISFSNAKFITGIAASILLIVFAYWGLQDAGQEQHLYAQYEYEDPGLPVVMSQSENYALYDALTYFGEEDYSTCIKKLKAIVGEKSDTIAYYLGACYYYEADYMNAIKQLNSLSLNESPFYEQAEWLTMMSYLKSDQKTAALEILQKISTNPEHQFFDKGQALFNKLNEQ